VASSEAGWLRERSAVITSLSKPKSVHEFLRDAKPNHSWTSGHEKLSLALKKLSFKRKCEAQAENQLLPAEKAFYYIGVVPACVDYY
jgi:hypothetical protein